MALSSPAPAPKPSQSPSPSPSPPPPLQHCFPEDSELSPPRSVKELLDRAADRLEQASEPPRLCKNPDAAQPSAATQTSERRHREALACAEEALRHDDQSVEAHHNRALALLSLGQPEQARLALTHALALAPDDPETLADAAELYIHHLPASSENTQIGLAYARHGKLQAQRSHPSSESKHRPTAQLATPAPSKAAAKASTRSERPPRPVAGTGQPSLLTQLLILEGQALSDLGRASAALAPLEEAIARSDSNQARYERGLVLFDLCRLKDAQRSFAELLKRTPDDAWVHHQLGLVLEMLGEPLAAERELASARKLAPQDFPEPLPIGKQEFRTLVSQEIVALPEQARSDLRLVALELTDLPNLADLTVDQPTLSPTIVGLFRGLPLGMPESEPRSIVLYRKNLLRIVTSRDELRTQVRTTLLHELGHLRGEDDDELRARGLE